MYRQFSLHTAVAALLMSMPAAVFCATGFCRFSYPGRRAPLSTLMRRKKRATTATASRGAFRAGDFVFVSGVVCRLMVGRNVRRRGPARGGFARLSKKPDEPWKRRVPAMLTSSKSCRFTFGTAATMGATKRVSSRPSLT